MNKTINILQICSNNKVYESHVVEEITKLHSAKFSFFLSSFIIDCYLEFYLLTLTFRLSLVTDPNFLRHYPVSITQDGYWLPGLSDRLRAGGIFLLRPRQQYRRTQIVAICLFLLYLCFSLCCSSYYNSFSFKIIRCYSGEGRREFCMINDWTKCV